MEFNSGFKGLNNLWQGICTHRWTDRYRCDVVRRGFWSTGAPHTIPSWTWFISELTRCQNQLKGVSCNGWAARCLYAAAEIRQGHTAMFRIQSHSSLSQAAKQQPSLQSITISFRLKKKFTAVRDYAFCPKSKGHFLNLNFSWQF